MKRISVGIVAALLFFLASTAQAERAGVVAPEGSADNSRRDHVEAAIVATVRALNLDPISGSALRRPGRAGVPHTNDELYAFATANQLVWLVTSEVTPLTGQYLFHVRVANLPLHRVEEIEVNVAEADEAARLRDVLSCMLRANGLGDDALRLTTDPAELARHQAEEAAAARAAAEQAAIAQQAEADARLRAQVQADHDAAERARAEAEQHEHDAAEARIRAAAEAERNAFVNRQRYANDPAHPWVALAGFGGTSVSAHGVARGGFSGDFRARIGHMVPGFTGLEGRAGLDLMFASVSAINLVVGGVYLRSPFAVPVHIGGGFEMGPLFSTTGSRNAFFMMRLSGNVSWNIIENFSVEGSLPELTYISAGAVGIGAHVRAAYRF